MFRRKRPSLNEIEAIFRNELAPEFGELESLRRSIYSTFFLCFLVCIALLFALGMSGHLGKKGDNVQIVIMIGFGLGIYLTGKKARAFQKQFKERIMIPVSKRFFPELSYHPESHIAKNQYDESDLFRKELNTYTGNDFFRGKLGEVDFEFSELLCQYTTGSGKNKQTHTAFRGFFFVGDFHRDLYFRTKIEPDLAESFFGVAGRGLQRIFSSKAEQLVDLENVDFEKLFKVTSGDQVEARFILTPKLMEKLVEFRKKVGNNVHLSFCNGKMFLAIATNHDYFEPNYFGDILSRKDLMKFIDMLILLMGVAEEFLQQPRMASIGSPPKMPPLPTLAKKGFIPVPPSRRMPPLPSIKKQ